MSDSDEELLASMLEDEEKCNPSTSSKFASEATPTTLSGNDAVVPPVNAVSVLRKFFGHQSFRPLQWKIIQNALDGNDQVVVMSTGYGKSVCYQLPSLYTEKLSIVISPLISLMNDQVENARSNGIQAACISGETDWKERQSILNSDNIRLLYITPEFALSNNALLTRYRNSKSIGLLAIDEAHCVSQWGHEFRPSYRQLAEVRQILGENIPVMALTATATAKVRMDIATSLQLHEPIITCAPLDRTNLYLSVRTPTNREGLLSLLTDEDEKNGKHFGGPTIIYCATRAVVDEVNECLSRKGVKCGRYHAGMSAVARRKAHESFVKDRITTIIATVAFGMGIDKPDVRNVIHYGAPKNIESYYQEIGRAGRDGFPSKCITFYAEQEIVKHRHRILDEKNLKNEYRLHLVDMLSHMERFLHTTSCRRFLLLSYFDDHVEKRPAHAGCCDLCDKLIEYENNSNGGSLIKTINYGNEAEILLRAIAIFQGYTGLGKVIDFIKGKANVAKPKQGNDFYGSGKHKTEVFWKELGRILRMYGYINETKSPKNKFIHLISLSDKGQNWLFSKNKELFLEPTPLLIGRIRVSDSSNGSRYIPLPQGSEPFQSNGELNALPVSVGKNIDFPNAMGSTIRRAVVQNTLLHLRILNRVKERVWKDCSCYCELTKSVGDSYFADLEKELYEIRTNLAIERDCGAHIIASNKCIQQLAMIRPSCIENLWMIGEMTEERQRKFGEKLVDAIVQFCSAHNIPMDCSVDPTLPEEIINKMSALNEAHTETYRNHVKGKLSLGDVAKQRAVSESTITTYFVNFVKNGLPIHLDAVGITKEHMDTVYKSIREYGSDIVRLKPIMERLPEGFIDYNRLKIIFAILEYEYGVEENSTNEKSPTAAAAGTANFTDGATSSTDKNDKKRTVPEWMKKPGGSPAVLIKKSKKSDLFS